MSMKQEGTVREYRKKFETIASHVKVQDQDLFAGLFSNGLREDIRAEVRLQRPKNLAEMMEVALLAEEKIGAAGRYGGLSKQTPMGRGNGGFKNWRPEFQNKANSEAASNTKSLEQSKGAPINGAKSVGGKEIEERRKKGLCFTCDEKYVPGHICKNKVLKILYVEEVDEEKSSEQKDDEEEIVWEGDLKSLHLCSIAGLSSKSSFMLKGRLGDLEVIVLVDCGATHNFVSMRLVAAYNLKVEDTPPCWVKVGNGQKILVKGVCRGVQLSLQGMMVTADCYVFPLDGEDFVLGIDWLEKLGNIKANFKDMTLKVKLGEKTVCLKGDPSLSKREASAKEIMVELQQPQEVYMVECRALQA